MSKIEISVEWETPTVFAGEEVKCTITFKNTTRPAASSTSASPAAQIRAPTSARERWKAELPSQTSPASATFPRPLPEARAGERKQPGHRPTLSLNAPVNTAARAAVPPGPATAHAGDGKQSVHNHKKSVSIISIGQQSTPTEDRDGGPKITPVQHVRNSHARSTSFQGLPVRRGSLPVSPQIPQTSIPSQTQGDSRSTTMPLPGMSPLNSDSEQRRAQNSSKDPAQPQESEQTASPDAPPRRVSDTLGLGLQASPVSQTVPAADGAGIRRHQSQRTSRAGQGSTVGDVTNRSLQRVTSPTGTEGTSRSSIDIYSHSNHSSETLQSEYVAPTTVSRPLMHRRQGSQLGPLRSETETLMMGYVQLIGSFILDGSLVNQAPFEEVKRRGIIGGQGSGGVVGLEVARRDNGLLGSLGWKSIGQSLGGFLGSEEPSSIREMKGIANSKAVPIISTAQSILFVDLQLKPGESKRFGYSHPLPRGVPPTFKGRAIKSSYNLVVGTQRPQSRPQGARSQHSVRQIEVPFKVLPAVDETGEVLGHDLMNPHVILKDVSKTKVLDSVGVKAQPYRPATLSLSRRDESEFKDYVKELLEGNRKDSNAGLLSPTASIPTTPGHQPNHLQTLLPLQLPVKDLIDMAIASSSAPGSSRAGSTSLQISRGGRKVAHVVLARTAFRIGETVLGSVDFTGADVSCFALHASLESAEVVDPAIALRSDASIHRATRRVHAQTAEHTLCAERVSFALTIPPGATPEFVTSGVRLEWKLRLEFVTEDTISGERARELLDVAEEDERGTFASATQELPTQTFEVPVALRVYGTTGGNPEVSPTKGYRV